MQRSARTGRCCCSRTCASTRRRRRTTRPSRASSRRSRDVYVNDAFGTAHRAHASTAGMVPFVKEKAAGLPDAQGARVPGQGARRTRRSRSSRSSAAPRSRDKIKVIENLLPKVDALLIGGAMANTFLKAQGDRGGQEPGRGGQARRWRARLLEAAQRLGKQLVLPVDHVVGTEPDGEGAADEVTPTGRFPPDMMGLDIGPKTRDAVRAAHPRREDGVLERADGPVRGADVRRGHAGGRARRWPSNRQRDHGGRRRRQRGGGAADGLRGAR